MSKSTALPADIEAENIVLTVMFRDPIFRKKAFGILEEIDFFNNENQEIYLAMRHVQEDFTPDAVIVSMKKASSIRNRAEGLYYAFRDVKDLDEGFYLSRVKDLSNRRKTMFACNSLIQAAADQEVNMDEEASNFRTKLLGFIQQDGIRAFSLQEVNRNFFQGSSFLDKIRSDNELYKQGYKVINGVETGYAPLDEGIGGFENGLNIIVAARPGSGKTTFLVSLLTKFLQRYPLDSALFFTLEMSKERIFRRFAQMYANISFKKFKGRLTDFDLETLEASSKMLESKNLYLVDRAGMSIEDIEAQAAFYKETKGVKIVFIDYLNIITPPVRGRSMPRHEAVGMISKGLYRISRTLNLPVVTLTQTSRQQKSEGRPTMSNIKESGQIEEDADVIMTLHRPSIEESPDKAAHMEDHTIVTVEKNREYGERFSFKMEIKNQMFEPVIPIEELNPEFMEYIPN